MTVSDLREEDGRLRYENPEAWAALARVVLERRREGWPSQLALARHADLSAGTLRKFETGAAASYLASNVEKLEDALGWPRGTVRAFLKAPDTPIDEVISEIQRQRRGVREHGRDHAAGLERDRRYALQDVETAVVAKERPEDLEAEQRAQMLRRAFDGATPEEAEQLLLEAARRARDIRPRTDT